MGGKKKVGSLRTLKMVTVREAQGMRGKVGDEKREGEMEGPGV